MDAFHARLEARDPARGRSRSCRIDLLCDKAVDVTMAASDPTAGGFATSPLTSPRPVRSSALPGTTKHSGEADRADQIRLG
jgi:hypothetical protein